MELEEAEDEEWDTSKYSSEPNAENGCKVRWVFNTGLRLGKKILVAGFVASAAPVVVPPLVVTSAIGLAVSMPYAIFLASHACTQNLMSKLLPRPTPQDPLLREEMRFRPDIYIIHTDKEEQTLADETKRDIEMVDAQYMKNGESMTSGGDCGPQEEDATDGMEGHSRGETNGVQLQPISGDNGLVTMIEELKTPFGVTTTVLEESQVQAMEGDIEEAELERETKGLSEKIRDEGRTDMTQERGEYVEGICGGANESDQKIGPVVEDIEVAWEDTHRMEEDPNVCEEMLQSRNDESEDTICNEVESGEPVSGLSEGKEIDNTNDSQKPMAEPSELLHGSFPYETCPDEPIGDLPIEPLVYNVSVDEDPFEVVIKKTDIHIVAEEEPKAPPDCPTLLQEGKLDNNISDFENQESQLHELNEMLYSSDAEAREIANESELDLFGGKRIGSDEYACTIDLHEESSNVDGHTDSTEVLVSSVEQESRPSECSSGENMTCPSQEVVFHEENIWKQIEVIRKIVGYEGTKQASCADELKALYIFTGVEPPSSLNENSSDPAEIEEKLHFLMSIIGIKSNMA
ncbi:hypothetical protein E2542_SST23567 [Spatholobus suberectus]|nr:hypothetical protein E2542_SST23567 [Spatholobus suberectus]